MRLNYGLISVIAIIFLAGCGGSGGGPINTTTGGSSGGSENKATSSVTATFSVNVATGKVTTLSGAPSKSPHIFTGNSISFGESVLTDIPGDTGVKALSVTLTNNSGLSLGSLSTGAATGVKVIFSPIVSSGTLTNLKPETTVAAYAGSVAGFADGPISSAKFNLPSGVAIGSDGSIYIADVNNNRIRKISQEFVSTLAGTGVAGELDGGTTKAEFNGPYGIAFNPVDGSLIVADYTGNKIRRVTSAGVVSTVAGTGTAGSANGAGNVATFTNPTDAAVDSNGNIYVSEATSNRIRKITHTGNPSLSSSYTVSTFAGSGTGGFVDGAGTSAEFSRPYGLSADPNGNVYVADYENNAIREIDPSGNVTTIAGTGATGDTDGFGNAATFDRPIGVVYANGALFESEASGDIVRQLTPVPGAANTPGGWLVQAIAGEAGVAGDGGGTGATAQFNSPRYLAVSQGSTIYMADFVNCIIRSIVPSSGTFPIGSPTGSSSADNVLLANPDGVVDDTAFGPSSPYIEYTGSLPNGSTSTSRIWDFSIPAGVAYFVFSVTVETDTSIPVGLAAAVGAPPSTNYVRTYAGTTTTGYQNGVAPEARFGDWIGGLALDENGILYAADEGNNAIRRIDTNGNVSTIAGVYPGPSGLVNGLGTVAQLNFPDGVAVTPDGSEVFVAERGNNDIRRIAFRGGDPTDPANWSVSTVAGNGTAGITEGVGNNAMFDSPYGIALSPGGNLYVTESGGNRVRKIVPTGGDRSQAANWYVSLLAGDDSAAVGATGTANGTGHAARFNSPFGIVVNSAGTIFVDDTLNDRIRQVTPDGAVTNFVGSSDGYADGQGTAALFNTPKGMCIDASGTIYVSDSGNGYIRRVTPSGDVETCSGIGGYGTVDGASNVAQYEQALGLAVNASGAIYSGERSGAIRLTERNFNTASSKARPK